MKRIYCLMVTLLLVVCASAQTKVTGTVYEEAGVGAIGAGVALYRSRKRNMKN